MPVPETGKPGSTGGAGSATSIADHPEGSPLEAYTPPPKPVEKKSEGVADEVVDGRLKKRAEQRALAPDGSDQFVIDDASDAAFLGTDYLQGQRAEEQQQLDTTFVAPSKTVREYTRSTYQGAQVISDDKVVEFAIKETEMVNQQTQKPFKTVDYAGTPLQERMDYNKDKDTFKYKKGTKYEPDMGVKDVWGLMEGTVTGWDEMDYGQKEKMYTYVMGEAADPMHPTKEEAERGIHKARTLLRPNKSDPSGGTKDWKLPNGEVIYSPRMSVSGDAENPQVTYSDQSDVRRLREKFKYVSEDQQEDVDEALEFYESSLRRRMTSPADRWNFSYNISSPQQILDLKRESDTLGMDQLGLGQDKDREPPQKKESQGKILDRAMPQNFRDSTEVSNVPKQAQAQVKQDADAVAAKLTDPKVVAQLGYEDAISHGKQIVEQNETRLADAETYVTKSEEVSGLEHQLEELEAEEAQETATKFDATPEGKAYKQAENDHAEATSKTNAIYNSMSPELFGESPTPGQQSTRQEAEAALQVMQGATNVEEWDKAKAKWDEAVLFEGGARDHTKLNESFAAERASLETMTSATDEAGRATAAPALSQARGQSQSTFSGLPPSAFGKTSQTATGKRAETLHALESMRNAETVAEWDEAKLLWDNAVAGESSLSDHADINAAFVAERAALQRRQTTSRAAEKVQEEISTDMASARSEKKRSEREDLESRLTAAQAELSEARGSLYQHDIERLDAASGNPEKIQAVYESIKKENETMKQMVSEMESTHRRLEDETHYEESRAKFQNSKSAFAELTTAAEKADPEGVNAAWEKLTGKPFDKPLTEKNVTTQGYKARAARTTAEKEATEAEVEKLTQQNDLKAQKRRTFTDKVEHAGKIAGWVPTISQKAGEFVEGLGAMREGYEKIIGYENTKERLDRISTARQQVMDNLLEKVTERGLEEITQSFESFMGLFKQEKKEQTEVQKEAAGRVTEEKRQAHAKTREGQMTITSATEGIDATTDKSEAEAEKLRKEAMARYYRENPKYG